MHQTPLPLSPSDIALIAGVSGQPAPDLTAALQRDPALLPRMLLEPALYAALFDRPDEALLRASPHLIFAVLLQHTARHIYTASYVEEWLGPGRRLPIFESEPLRRFAARQEHLHFLAGVLASYTRVASGSLWFQTAYGWRRQRFSDLDPLRVLELISAASPRERPALSRRLGDLCLFLTGVFPDYAGGPLLGPRAKRRLQRLLGWEGAPLDLLQALGQRSYAEADQPVPHSMAEQYGTARRLLNVLTDRYLFQNRASWFGIQ